MTEDFGDEAHPRVDTRQHPDLVRRTLLADVARRLAAAVDDLAAAQRLRRCPHRMVQMSDGPACATCGRTWLWV